MGYIGRFCWWLHWFYLSFYRRYCDMPDFYRATSANYRFKRRAKKDNVKFSKVTNKSI